MASGQTITLRVFVSSPSDVQEEREIARRVIDEVNEGFHKYPVRLEFVGWEGASPSFGSDPQEVINRYVGDDYDIFVGILWTRFGTPTPRAGSGTEEEFQVAYERWQADQSSVDIMLFFSDVPMPPQSDALQLARVQRFRDSVSGLGGLYNAFPNRDEFRSSLHIALTRRVSEEIFQEGPREAAFPTPEEKAADILSPEPVVLTDVEISEEMVTGIPEEDAYIITHPVSRDRVDAFYEEFLRDREQAAAGEKVFRRAEAFTVSNDWKDDVAVGFNVLLHRGPFVEGSNWAPYRTWEFAVAAEQRLLNQFATLLQDNAAFGEGEVGLNWKDIFAEVDKLRVRLEGDKYSPSLIVVTGRLGTHLMVDLNNHVVPDWELGQELRALWIEGTYDDIPILNIRDDDTPYGFYVLDLSEFAVLTRYSPPAKLKIQGIDRARAQEVLAKRVEAGNPPEGWPDTEPQETLQLLLRVQLLMFESSEIELVNPAAALGAKLTPPSAE